MRRARLLTAGAACLALLVLIACWEDSAPVEDSVLEEMETSMAVRDSTTPEQQVQLLQRNIVSAKAFAVLSSTQLPPPTDDHGTSYAILNTFLQRLARAPSASNSIAQYAKIIGHMRGRLRAMSPAPQEGLAMLQRIDDAVTKGKGIVQGERPGAWVMSLRIGDDASSLPMKDVRVSYSAFSEAVSKLQAVNANAAHLEAVAAQQRLLSESSAAARRQRAKRVMMDAKAKADALLEDAKHKAAGLLQEPAAEEHEVPVPVPEATPHPVVQASPTDVQTDSHGSSSAETKAQANAAAAFLTRYKKDAAVEKAALATEAMQAAQAEAKALEKAKAALAKKASQTQVDQIVKQQADAELKHAHASRGVDEVIAESDQRDHGTTHQVPSLHSVLKALPSWRDDKASSKHDERSKPTAIDEHASAIMSELPRSTHATLKKGNAGVRPGRTRKGVLKSKQKAGRKETKKATMTQSQKQAELALSLKLEKGAPMLQKQVTKAPKEEDQKAKAGNEKEQKRVANNVLQQVRDMQKKALQKRAPVKTSPLRQEVARSLPAHNVGGVHWSNGHLAGNEVIFPGNEAKNRDVETILSFAGMGHPTQQYEEDEDDAFDAEEDDFDPEESSRVVLGGLHTAALQREDDAQYHRMQASDDVDTFIDEDTLPLHAATAGPSQATQDAATRLGFSLAPSRPSAAKVHYKPLTRGVDHVYDYLNVDDDEGYGDNW
jgi:hypothetical protein